MKTFLITFCRCMLFFVSASFALNTIAQNGFYKVYGTANDDMILNVSRCADGGYYILGRTQPSAFRENAFIIRTTTSGEILWNKIIEFDTTSVWIQGGEMLSDESYVLTYMEYNPIYQIVTTLVKLNQSGDILWTKIFLGFHALWTKPIIPLSNGEFLVAGRYQYIMGGPYYGSIMKIDTSGNTVFHSTFSSGAQGPDAFVNDFAISPDGEIIAVGYTIEDFQTYPLQSFLIKLDLNGNFISGETYMDTVDVSISKICPNVNHTYALLCDDQLLITDTAGTILQTRKNVGSDKVYTITLSNDSGYFMTGVSYTQAEYNIGLTRTTNIGDTIWTKTFLAAGIPDKFIVDTNDKGIIVPSFTDTLTNVLGGEDIAFIKTDYPGNSFCYGNNQFDINFQNTVNTIIGFDSTYLFSTTGFIQNYPASHVVSSFSGIFSDTICSPQAVQDVNILSNIIISPNPVSQNTFKISTGGKKVESLRMITLEGKLIPGAVQTSSQTQKEISLVLTAAVPNGIYLLLITSSGLQFPVKMVVMR